MLLYLYIVQFAGMWMFIIVDPHCCCCCCFRYGCTKIIISDQGREFVNKINKRLFKKFKTEHRISSAYHPQTNGLVERYNQTLQRSLVKLVNNQQTDWDEYLDGVLFAYRTSVQKSTKITPFELMYGRYVNNFSRNHTLYAAACLQVTMHGSSYM